TAASLMDDVLKDGTEARKLAVELKNVQYSEQLVQQLFKHSEQMETLYGSFQELMGCSETKEKKFRKAIDLANDKMKWFAKSKEGLIGQGKVHVRTVASLAQASWEDGQAPPAFAYFASLGNFGCIPRTFHCDGAEFFRNTEFMVMDIKFPLCIVPHECMRSPQVRRDVHTKVAHLMSWSMTWALKGVWPEQGFQDEAFLEWTAIVLQLEDNNYPELGTAWKAAHVKLALWYITKPACDFAEERDDPILEVGASCSWALLSAIESMDAAGLIMTEEQAVQTHQGLMEHLHCWHATRASCISAAVKRWDVRPKHHYAEHCAEAVLRTRVNPRRLSCFQDESFLGAVKAVATKCHSTTALLRVFQRLVLNLGQRFKNSRDEKHHSTGKRRRNSVSSLL
ncbi:Uncharacterized protein SCF082_LOCUS25524, partial [Durusdinium trenchii]